MGKSGLPILPIGIRGTRQALPPRARRIRPGGVVVHVGAPIITSNLRAADRPQLTETAKSAISWLAGLTGK